MGQPDQPVTTLRSASGKRLRELGGQQGTPAAQRPAAKGTRDALARRLLESGLALGRSNGDGNCLYRAMTDQLSRDDGDGHAAVRSHAAAFLSANRGLYAETYPGQLLDDHAAVVSRDKADGDEVDLDAIARHYNRDIVVHMMRDPAQPRPCLHGDGKAPPLHIAFVNDGHYDTVRYAVDAARNSWSAWIAAEHEKAARADAARVAADASRTPAAPSTAAAPSGPPAAQVALAAATSAAPSAAAMAAIAPAEAGLSAPVPPLSSAPVPPLNSAAPVVDRMCAPTALSQGLALYCNITRTPEEVQR